MGSILNTIKKLLGITEEYYQFDQDLIVTINTVLATLAQLGVRPEGYSIIGQDETWEDYIGYNKLLEPVKSYVYMKTKLMFDPPMTTNAMESLNKLIAELEWRINVIAEGANK